MHSSHPKMVETTLLKTSTGKKKLLLLLLETAATGKKIYVREATGVLRKIHNFNHGFYSKNIEKPRNGFPRF